MNNNKSTIDTSISDDERIIISDIDKKISRLGYYINRVHQRMSVLNRKKESEKVNKTTQLIENKMTTQTIRVKQ